MNIKFENLSINERYYLMTQTIIPRPIAWILSQSQDQGFNLAPFSYFTAVSSQPPILMVSIGKRPDNQQDKDTLQNLNKNPFCTIHIASVDSEEKLSQSAQPLPYGESELQHYGIATTDFPEFSLPRLADAKIAYACKVFEFKSIVQQTLVFVEIMSVYLSEEIVEKQGKRLHIDSNRVNPLARLGPKTYSPLGEPFRQS